MDFQKPTALRCSSLTRSTRSLTTMVGTLVYSVIGVAIFYLSFAAFDKLTPFSVRKEIEEDQNTALGIVIGSMLIGVAIIIAAAVQG